MRSFSLQNIKRQNCFTYIKRLLSREWVKALDWLLALRCRRLKCQLNIDFIRLCLKCCVYTTKRRRQLERNRLKATVSVCNDYLRAELTSAEEILTNIERSIACVSLVLHRLDFIGFCKYQNMTKFTIEKLRERLNGKYRRLQDSCAPVFPLDMDRRITNLSSRALSQTERQSLCLFLSWTGLLYPSEAYGPITAQLRVREPVSAASGCNAAVF